MERIVVSAETNPLLRLFIKNAVNLPIEKRKQQLGELIRENQRSFAKRENFVAVVGILIDLMEFDVIEFATALGISPKTLEGYAAGHNVAPEPLRLSLMVYLSDRLLE